MDLEMILSLSIYTYIYIYTCISSLMIHNHIFSCKDTSCLSLSLSLSLALSLSVSFCLLLHCLLQPGYVWQLRRSFIASTELGSFEHSRGLFYFSKSWHGRGESGCWVALVFGRKNRIETVRRHEDLPGFAVVRYQYEKIEKRKHVLVPQCM